MIYLVQIPESYTDEQYSQVKRGLDANVRLNQKYEVVVCTYSGNEIKHTVLGDSFNKELYEAKVFRDTLCNILDNKSVRVSCVGLGSKEVSETYGFEEGSFENFIATIVIDFFKQAKQINELKKVNEELEHKIKMLSL